MNPIRVNPEAQVLRQEIGPGIQCVIVEDFLENPEEVVEFAALRAQDFTPPGKGNYPGLLLRMDGNVMTDVYLYIRSRMSRAFSFMRGDMTLWTYLSLATLRTGELSHRQRLCHTDPCSDPRRTCFAALVYLFGDDRLGGTGFFRWKDEGLMRSVRAAERNEPEGGLKKLREQIPDFRHPAGYMTDSNEIAELVRTIPARFNRMVFYPGTVPHGAAITEPERLSTNVRQGRLTLNVFADVLPKAA